MSGSSRIGIFRLGVLTESRGRVRAGMIDQNLGKEVAVR